MAGTLETDVIVVGGGLVGGTLACALAEGGLGAVVVDRMPPEAGLDAGFDGRAFAVALGSQRLLERVGLWSAMASEACPILDIRVADGDSPLFLHYDHRETGAEPFGYLVEALTIRRALARRLPRLAGVLHLAPATVVEWWRRDGWVEARLDDGRRVRASVLVGADGRDSATRHRAGIRVTRLAYGQTAIVTAVAHERPHDNLAVEHFRASGPFAILPLNGNRSSIVWTEREDLTPAIMALDDEAFLAELAERFGDHLGALRLAGGRWSYPLSLQYAERAVERRLALVGDAAHAMHPIAGQGLNIGFRDVAALAEVLTDARRLGLDVGEVAVLRRYRRWRRFDTAVMMAATDGINRLFSNRIPPIRLARDLGLAAVHRLPPLKRAFVRQAMGLAGDLPRLMRGEAL
jgi:2-octaprenyl-6-methoxyphenol hydroxylase